MSKICNLKKYFSPTDAVNSRTNNFNILRLFAAFMVIYGHMCHIMGLPVYCIYGQAVSTIGVKILFVISGFLIAKSLLSDSHFGRYMIRRVFRIFPGLIGVVLGAVLVVGPIFTGLPLKDYFTNYSTLAYLKNIALYPMYALPGVFTEYTYPNAVNGSLWTLPIEFSLYLILPLFLVIFKKLKITKVGMLSVAIGSIVLNCVFMKYFQTARLVFYGTNWVDCLAIIPYFFVGGFLALPEMKKIFNLQIAVALMLFMAIFQLNTIKSECLMGIILPYFVLSFSLVERPVFSQWFSKSDFSYGLYLYGFVVQQVIWHQLQKLNNPIFSLNVSFVICLVVTFICAVISWYIIEKPMQTLGKKLVEKSLNKSKQSL